ncbi:MAG: ECF transporter S component [Oligoflexia bacterium]|nr:ECF transporter S component [Oligoflexia bacterium]
MNLGNVSSRGQLFHITIFELTLAAVLSVALGVAFWGWSLFYELFKPLLKGIGLKYLLTGFWILPSVLPIYIIRRPGVAFFSSVVASLVEGLVSNWGIMAGAWGAVQGMAAELVFACFLYRRWNYFELFLAVSASAIASYSLDYFYYHYSLLTEKFNCIQLFSFIVSSMFLAGYVTIFLCNKLVKTGLLNNFRIVRDRKMFW